MNRPLSYLSDETLDQLLSAALKMAVGFGRYDEMGCWSGDYPPQCVVEVIEEYKIRHTKKRRPR